ncbi:Methyl-accepting chemotaxis protein I [Burkholderia multivorans]
MARKLMSICRTSFYQQENKGVFLVQSLKNMKVRTQLLLGFAAVIALLIGLGGFSLVEISGENSHVAELRDNWLPSVRSALQMKGALSQMRLAEYRIASAATPAEVQDAEARIESSIAVHRRAAAEYEKVISAPEEKAAYADIQPLMRQYLDLDQQIRSFAREGKQADAMTLVRGQTSTIRDAIDKDIQTIVDINVTGSIREGEQANSAFSRAVAMVVGLIIAAVAMALGVALVITRGLTRQLGGEPRDAAALASEIAAGNLRVAVSLRSGDRSSLMYSLNSMRNHLTTIVRGIQASSESISIAASQIAQGNTDLSQRTEEQAASLEETASSMEELNSTVRHNADNARQATALASTTSGVAQQGGEVVGRVVQTMQGISGSSARMAEIIGVIEGIAFQTNILALNAAVEAARAGEQGRGFAVVAGEVRTLAQRSAAAAKEIKEMIDDASGRVDAGAKLVEEAGSTINEVVQSVKRAADLVSEIAAASDEQSTGIGQVNTAVSQMDQVTQQNAALVEEAAAATQAMAEQAKALRQAVAVFQVDAAEPVSVPLAKTVRTAPAAADVTKSTRVPSAPRTKPSSTASVANTRFSGAPEPDWQTF